MGDTVSPISNWYHRDYVREIKIDLEAADVVVAVA